jgi:hypothetical protein
LEALELTNGAELAELLKNGAERISTQPGRASPRKVVPQLYEKALGREPTTQELRLAKALVLTSDVANQKAGLEDLLWSLAMLPEFQLIY